MLSALTTLHIGGIPMQSNDIIFETSKFRLTIGERTFRAAGILRVFRQSCCASVSYVSPEGRLLLLRWYETEASIRNSDNYPEHWIRTIAENETLHINRVRYIHTEDRIGEIVL